MEDKVTEIQIIPVKPKDGLVGFANFVFDGAFYFASIGIYTRLHGGYRLTYPTRKTMHGDMPLFHPINKDTANLIEQAIIKQFERLHGNEQ